MAVRSRDRTKPSIRDLIADDAQVVALESFRPQMVASMIERGRFYKLNDSVVRQWPAYFAILIPVEQFLGEIEIER
jgi:hypothetical protein